MYIFPSHHLWSFHNVVITFPNTLKHNLSDPKQAALSPVLSDHRVVHCSYYSVVTNHNSADYRNHTTAPHLICLLAFCFGQNGYWHSYKDQLVCIINLGMCI